MIMVSSDAGDLGRRVGRGRGRDRRQELRPRLCVENQGQKKHEPEKGIGGYYINAAQAGEPPGRWWGPGGQALGFAAGQEVERGLYDAVYQQRDPRTGKKLGRARGSYLRFSDHLARLRAAEPHATAERLVELEREAAKAVREPAAYTDVTVSSSNGSWFGSSGEGQDLAGRPGKAI
jgi:hypothetical protein